MLWSFLFLLAVSGGGFLLKGYAGALVAACLFLPAVMGVFGK